MSPVSGDNHLALRVKLEIVKVYINYKRHDSMEKHTYCGFCRKTHVFFDDHSNSVNETPNCIRAEQSTHRKGPIWYW